MRLKFTALVLACAAPLAAGGHALVCRDGPAFDAGKIAWQGML